MTAHGRISPPTGHGEVLCEPPYPSWARLVETTRERVALWPACLRRLRQEARSEVLALASGWSGSIGIDIPDVCADVPLIATGHQPELFHAGVWAKHFLIDRLASQLGGAGIDIVVDTDRAEAVELRLPVLGQPVSVRGITLSSSSEGAYVQTPVPSREAIEAFCSEGSDVLKALPSPALLRHFRRFCDALERAADLAGDLGAFMTAARRIYEAPAKTSYLEAPASGLARTSAFLDFAGALLDDAAVFRRIYNEELSLYRMRTGTRSSAQPFPDLAARDGSVESPFWLLDDGRRQRVWVGGDGVLRSGEVPVDVVGELRGGASALLRELRRAGVTLAPKALTVTMFVRMFCADLFVHGIGGGRYDRVTDAVIARYYGVEPPPYAIASLTMLLPLGARISSERELRTLSQDLHRLKHNPDTFVDEVEFDDVVECRRARELVAFKRALIEKMASPEADRRLLGAQIRQANAELRQMLQPVAEDLEVQLEKAQAAERAAEVLSDRTYAYCLWDALEVMDKVR